MQNGDPVRIGFVGTPGSTSASLGLFVPGSNNPAAFDQFSFLYITSLLCEANGVANIIFLPAGSSTLVSSTIAASFLSTGNWHDGHGEAMSGPQGVIPSVYTPVSTTAVNITGTGMICRSPGYIQPWVAPGTPAL